MSPSNGKASTTSSTITGKTFVDHYLDRVTVRCDFCSPSGLQLATVRLWVCGSDVCSLLRDTERWNWFLDSRLSSLHGKVSQSQSAALIMTCSQCNPLWVDMHSGSNTHRAGSAFTSWLHNSLPTCSMDMYAFTQIHHPGWFALINVVTSCQNSLMRIVKKSESW